MKNHILLINSPDEKGLVYKITSRLYENDLNIEKNDEFVDPDNKKFFMRTAFSGSIHKERLEASIVSALPELASVKLIEKHTKKIVLMATTESHCLGDILLRHDSDELDAEIQCVVSNHETLKPLVKRFDIPFYHIPHHDLERNEHEMKIQERLKEIDPDYIVLAKYMRILTPDFVKAFPEQIINIHHSFLPAFIGANPYKQAYERGVKIIGATAHFVNNNLDEGPIIAQDVTQVDHSYSWKEMQKAGRDVEKNVLARALHLTLEDRIFIYGNKTVVF